MNYADLVATVSNETVIDPTDPEFLQILPQAITYGEQRLYRELDLLTTVVRDSSATLTVGTRDFTLPQSLGRFVVTNGINLITPSTQADPSAGTRNQLLPVSRDYMDAVWPSSSYTAQPVSYCMITDQLINVGPFPDAAYTLEVIGTIRPTPLSADNPTTFLSLYLPDLFTAAVMISMTGYQKNWGAQADDPNMAVSWESQYDKLFASANVEENRKKYASGAWGSLQPTPIASPGR